MKTFVIGDVHGGLKALEQVIEKAHIGSEDTVVFVGDLVDGWSQSAQVIEYLIQFAEQHTCVFIKGNHDEWCENWLDNRAAPDQWVNHGGQETIDSYESISEEDKVKHKAFFNAMVDYHVDSENRLFIHAGFTSMHGPDKEIHKSNFMWDRTLWEMALALDPSLREYSAYYPQRLKLFKEIYIGHTPTTHYNSIDFPINRANVWNVDTGAGFKGKISCLNCASKAYVQSDPVHEMYPEEVGRNK
mgnify:CR=1 FL=1